ncbi:MAG: DUF3090 family protein [Actinobacteria bacterium]|nr:DUF3090 family protein [Actinomycetota bacterium]MBW3650535.1 DUF3090 family protein [Actinomycetota bacterium]
MSRSFELPLVDTVTVGTIGVPGQRVFYLQARAGTTLVTLKMEKQQVGALGAALLEMLADLPPPTGGEGAPELQEPIEPAWVAGTMGLSPYDEDSQRVTLLLEELVPEGEDGGASAQLGLTVGQMFALAARAEELLGQGRPPCPLCNNPIDPRGHSCPKTNGKLRH